MFYIVAQYNQDDYNERLELTEGRLSTVLYMQGRITKGCASNYHLLDRV